MSNIKPAKPMAGVIVGWMGKAFAESGTGMAVAEAIGGTDVDGASIIVVDIVTVEGVFAPLPVAFDVSRDDVEAAGVVFVEPSEEG